MFLILYCECEIFHLGINEVSINPSVFNVSDTLHWLAASHFFCVVIYLFLISSIMEIKMTDIHRVAPENRGNSFRYLIFLDLCQSKAALHNDVALCYRLLKSNKISDDLLDSILMDVKRIKWFGTQNKLQAGVVDKPLSRRHPVLHNSALISIKGTFLVKWS